MKLFKKLLVIITLIAPIAGSNHAMEKPTQATVSYSDPIETYSCEDFKIAASLGTAEIGHIEYTLEKRKATILHFEVQKDYQNNNKQERVGQRLFQKCVDHVLSRGYSELEWTANPIPSNKLDLATICTIYEKIVRRLENSNSYELKQGKEIGMHNPRKHMKLIFNNQTDEI